MSIHETPLPCFVASCDRCGLSTWPPAQTKEGAWDIARHSYEFWRRGNRMLCTGCKLKPETATQRRSPEQKDGKSG